MLFGSRFESKAVIEVWCHHKSQRKLTGHIIIKWVILTWTRGSHHNKHVKVGRLCLWIGPTHQRTQSKRLT
ncbi:hypothetical protein Hanom_Chr05g00451301 [Helianthus anomalus]